MDVEDPPQMWVSHHLAWSPDLKKKGKSKLIVSTHPAVPSDHGCSDQLPQALAAGHDFLPMTDYTLIHEPKKSLPVICSHHFPKAYVLRAWSGVGGSGHGEARAS